jgi:hypothetical protein
MIETSKQKLTELGAAGYNIAKAPVGIAAGAMSTPLAAAYDTATNAVKAVPKVALGAVGALTGLEAPKTPGFNYSTAEKTTGLIGSSVSDAAKGFGVIGQNIKQGLKGVGFTEPVATSAPAPNANPTISASAPSGAAPVASSKVASPSVNAVSRPEGDPNFFKGGATLQPSTGLGASPSSTGMNDKDLADWKARGVKLGVVGASQIENPGISNNELYNSKNPEYVKMEEVRANPILSKINDISNNISSDPLTRKYQLLQIGALNQTLDKQNEVRGQDIGSETTRRGQDIAAETARREQDINTKIHGDKTLLDTFYKTGLLEQGKEELGIKKLQAEAKDLPGYLKLVTSMSPKIKTTDPVTGAETESHDVAKGVELLTQAGFATPKGFKAPSLIEKPIITPEQAKAEIERRKSQKK